MSDIVTTGATSDGFRDEYVDITVEQSEPVKVKLDLNRMKWGDLVSLQNAVTGKADSMTENLAIITTILNKVMVGTTVDDLPVLSFQRVLKYIMDRMQAAANQGN